MTKLLPGFSVENYTTHQVILVHPDGSKTTIEQEPRAPLRLNTIRKRINPLLFHITFSEPTFVPPKCHGLFYIVSSSVKLALPFRDDFITPNDLVRDYSGRITACRSFAL